MNNDQNDEDLTKPQSTRQYNQIIICSQTQNIQVLKQIVGNKKKGWHKTFKSTLKVFIFFFMIKDQIFKAQEKIILIIAMRKGSKLETRIMIRIVNDD